MTAAYAPPLPGMPRRLFACTPSRLAGFDCPRRYRFAYLNRPTPQRGRPWAHNTLGAVVHLALARWWSLPPERRTPNAGAALVSGSWQHDGFRDVDHSARWRSVAGEWVRHYLARVDPAQHPVGVERTFSTTTRALVINGRIDRLDARGAELVIVDYKTGRHECTAEDARGSQALALYVLAARRTLRRACRRVELHHLPTNTVAAFEHTDDSLTRHVSRAEATAAEIADATGRLASGADPDDAFPPRPSLSCGWCDFRAHCPEGRAVTKGFEPWAGLDGDP